MRIPPGIKLDLDRPHRWVGPRDEEGYTWALQDGLIFCWSSSNTQYETAWWLNSKGLPQRGETLGQQQKIQELCKRNPFNKRWLN